MSKVVSRQPRWLDHDTPASGFFAADAGDKARFANDDRDRMLKTVAHRGTEIFLAVGNELRWGDLSILKEAGESHDVGYGRQGEHNKQAAYRVLRTPAARSISQLSVSPSGDFIAVLTSHTCHVCVLPSREHLKYQDTQPIKLRSFHVGPTIHVLEQSPIASAIWHPLSPSGNGLVTVTRDAGVRLWELDQNNRSSFNEPSLNVDLKKLANATTSRDDLSASRYGANKGFSADDVDMQIASSCFGGQGREDEDGWASMTIWFAMTEGDVYALCPFLPSQFWMPPTMLPSLSTSVVGRNRFLDHENNAAEAERLVARQQSSWLKELDEQEATVLGGLQTMEVYSRPEKHGPYSRLQGPFQMTPESYFGEVTDIHVIAPKLDDEALFDDQEDFDLLGTDDGLSIGVVCLTTSKQQVHICLNVEGVEAEWLPPRGSRVRNQDDLNAKKELVRLETIEFARPNQEFGGGCWPTFTVSPADRYEVFTTQPTGIYTLSFRPWIAGLEDELAASGAVAEGVGFRLKILLDSSSTIVNSVTAPFDTPKSDLSAAIAVLDDAYLGYIALTCGLNAPAAAVLSIPSTSSHPFAPELAESNPILTPESRAPYQPSEVFKQQSALPAQLDAWARESAVGIGDDLKGSILFSPFTLQKITETHRTLSSETHTLGVAAADLFRRCERMVSEMQAQVARVRELADRIDSVVGENEFPEERAADAADTATATSVPLVRGGRRKIETRIRDSRDKTATICNRIERLRAKTRSLAPTATLSAKERLFAAEVALLERNLLLAPFPSSSPTAAATDAAAPTSPAMILRMENSDLTTYTESDSVARSESEERNEDEVNDGEATLEGRFRAARGVYDDLMAQVRATQEEVEAVAVDGDTSRPQTAGGSSQAGGYRRQKLARVFELLERETALVNAVGERLERLQLASR